MTNEQKHAPPRVGDVMVHSGAGWDRGLTATRVVAVYKGYFRTDNGRSWNIRESGNYILRGRNRGSFSGPFSCERFDEKQHGPKIRATRLGAFARDFSFRLPNFSIDKIEALQEWEQAYDAKANDDSSHGN